MAASTRSKRIRFFPETSTFCKAWTSKQHRTHANTHHQLEHNENGWTLYSEDAAWTCDQLIVSAFYTQMLELLPEPIQTDVSEAIQVNETAACSVMLRFDTPINLPNQWDGGFVENNLIHFLSKQDFVQKDDIGRWCWMETGRKLESTATTC